MMLQRRDEQRSWVRVKPSKSWMNFGFSYKNVLIFTFLWVASFSERIAFQGAKIVVKEEKGSEPMAHMENSKMTISKQVFTGVLKDDELWKERMESLGSFGEVNKINGEFILKKCSICSSPWISHEDIGNETVCDKVKSRGEKVDDIETKNIIQFH